MKSFFTLIIFFSICHFTYSQQQYEWHTYGISFSLADDFVETVNNIDEFSAVGDGMELSIVPFKNDEIDATDIASFTLEIAASLDFERIDDISLIEFNNFEGAYAEGVSDGVKVFIMGLIDPDSDTNFFIIISFLDEDENAIEEAINICTSIERL
ncbi:MAG TPA: hypothetical protein PLU49_10405 [Saprospiraceae bacterium]|nr:hypothetical protein [Saprospirales bacterium]HRQ30474.1 hypothetical protein [Saprospiraceae bacterium]